MGRRACNAAPVAYVKARASRRPFIRLDLNENRFAAAPQVRRALRRLNGDELAMYPEDGPLRRSLARLHGVDAASVLLANGGDQAIRLVFDAFLGAGDEVVWASPTFSVYPLAAALRQARVRAVPFGPGFAFPQQGILKALQRRPALLVLVSPNNPTGTVIGDGELAEILERAGRTPVLLDEAYGFFSGSDHGAWIRRFPSLVVLNSFSKAFALAGVRLGYLLAAPSLRQRLEAVALPFPLGTPAIVAGLAALGNLEHARSRARRLRRQQRALVAGLGKLGITCRATAANFVLAGVGNAKRVQAGLRRAGILVKRFPGEPRLAGCLRITVGTATDTRALLRALAGQLPPQALLFDLDGVLVDSRPSCDGAIRATVAHFSGQRPSQRELEDMRLSGGCNNDWDAAAALLRRRGVRVPFVELRRRFQEIYLGDDGVGLRNRERWLATRPLLRRLGRRWALGIVTGRPRAEALWTLGRSGCASLFRVVVAAEDTGARPKPDPLGIRLALRRLGMRRAAYFGDQVDDMQAARAAGCRAVAVVLQQGQAAARRGMALRRAGAECVIGGMEEIWEGLHETSAH